MKGAVEESLGFRKIKKSKPWFEEKCKALHEDRKRARLQWLQNRTEANVNNYNEAKQLASRGFRQKKRKIN